MKARSIPTLLTIFFSLSIQISLAQMEVVINKVQGKIISIENNDRIIERTLYDFLARDNQSIFTYEYYFFRNNRYNISAIGDGVKLQNVSIKLYQKQGSNWQLLRQTNYQNNTDVQLQHTPVENGKYKINIECSFKPDYVASSFGLIIDREY